MGSTVRALGLSTLRPWALRNLEDEAISLGPGFNVFFGDNGQGKTSILEAVYLLATARSFRTRRLLELVAHGQVEGGASGTFDDGGLSRRQSVTLERNARVVRVEDKRPRTLASYARATPVVVFHPAEMDISQGGGAERRRILDRVALYASEVAQDASQAYTKALRSRQRVLETRGVRAPELEDFEAIVVRHGVAIMNARERVATDLAPLAEGAFTRVGKGTLSLAYEPSAPRSAEEYAKVLSSRRDADLRRGSAGVGPHKDDVALLLDGRDARPTASQGQHRAIVIGIKLAEIDLLSLSTGATPILLLDDVSSELDQERLVALFAALGTRRGQVLLTTTRHDLRGGLFTEERAVRHFRMISGRATPA